MVRRRRSERAAQYGSATYRDLVDRVAGNVRRLRRENGWTQDQAAEKCDLSTSFLQRIEGAGTNLTFTTLARLCDGFEVDARQLLKPGRIR